MTLKTSTKIRFKPIGYVENEINEMVAPAKIRAVELRIILDPVFEAGLKSIVPES